MEFNPTKNCQIIDFNHIFVDDLQKSCLFDLNRKKNLYFLSSEYGPNCSTVQQTLCIMLNIRPAAASYRSKHNAEARGKPSCVVQGHNSLV